MATDDTQQATPAAVDGGPAPSSSASPPPSSLTARPLGAPDAQAGDVHDGGPAPTGGERGQPSAHIGSAAHVITHGALAEAVSAGAAPDFGPGAAPPPTAAGES